MKESTENNGNIIEINEARIKKDLSGLVRETVEETLYGMLDAEADALCNGERYSRTPDRKDTRAGHYKRSLETTAGKVTLKVPKLRTIPFESAIIKRYQRREISVEEAMIEMYLAGVSVRPVEVARRPKTRYAVGAFARPTIFMRKWGGDRFYDWFLGSVIK